MKKLIVFVLALAMVLSLAACGGDTPASTNAPQSTQATQAPETTKAPETAASTEAAGSEAAPADANWDTKGLPAVTQGCLKGELLITSVGQSTEAATLANLLKRAKATGYTFDGTVDANAVTSKYSVLVMVVGGSSKGLGGAGLDQAAETARVTAVIKKAQELGMTIVCMHTGGTDRRGTLSDAFIDLAFPYAQYAVILADGDTDNYMHDILAKNNVPTAYVEKSVDARTVITYMMGQ
jgi:predicted small lipoprotein YifL